ncbi:hypothetical protein Ga0074812_10465 [Parafrankia irregularis]|uniref:Uncharacterized protein n=1 Tax=Parafrankia irregularis TaxID=795642 RepID=A0A0S4QIC2_9ACTN|nr:MULTISPECIES: hypothetical protein [Parafrankia]MBE3204139.1 hypothetical protein [Parafrankia sp. CH37]CUU54985.1 hypothetical protein Ga0074812_10465 [Parafrankia irregularis]
MTTHLLLALVLAIEVLVSILIAMIAALLVRRDGASVATAVERSATAFGGAFTLMLAVTALWLQGT